MNEPKKNSVAVNKAVPAIKIAKQANKLGVKSLDGEESQGKNYLLSFNAFSV